MTEESLNKHEPDPKLVRLIHAMMELVGELEHFESHEEVVNGWTKDERSQALDYFRAIVRRFAPWFTAFRKVKAREGK